MPPVSSWPPHPDQRLSSAAASVNRRYAAARPRPRSLLVHAVRVDGRLDGFEADVSLVLETAGCFEARRS
jgi:hypothetical protein